MSPEDADGRFAGPARIGVDARGNLYVPDLDRVYVFAPDGTPRMTLGGDGADSDRFGHAIDAAADAAGNVYVSDAATNQVHVFYPTGRFLAAWGAAGGAPGQFVEVDALAVDNAGQIYVLDFGNRRVQAFRLLATLVPASGTPVAAASPVAAP